MRLGLLSREIRGISGAISLPTGSPLGLKLQSNFKGRDRVEEKVRSRIVSEYALADVSRACPCGVYIINFSLFIKEK